MTALVGAASGIHTTPTTNHVVAFAPGSSFRQAVRTSPGQRVFAAPPQDDNQDLLSATINKVDKVLSSSTPVLNIPLGYPLALLTATVLLPWSTSLLLIASFAGYLYLGRGVLASDDDEDDDNGAILPLVALVGAIASAGLLSPDSFGEMTGNSIARAIGIGFLGLGVATFVESLDGENTSSESVSPDEELLDFWDEKFKRDQEFLAREENDEE